MRKILFIIISFILCALGKLTHEWLCFFPVFLLFSLSEISSSLMWEIPAGCIVSDILIHLFMEYEHALFRILIIAAASLIPIVSPKKLIIFFPLSAILIALGTDDRTGSFIMAGIISGTLHSIITQRKKLFAKSLSEKSFS